MRFLDSFKKPVYPRISLICMVLFLVIMVWIGVMTIFTDEPKELKIMLIAVIGLLVLFLSLGFWTIQREKKSGKSKRKQDFLKRQ
jgi:heme A synthase